MKRDHKHFLKQDIMALVLLYVISLSLIYIKEPNSWQEMFPTLIRFFYLREAVRKMDTERDV